MNHLSRRRQARELALQILFQSEFAKELSTSESLNHFQKQFEAHSEVFTYAESLVDGVKKHCEEIDKVIIEHSQNWGINRLALVEKNILRISIFELLFSSLDTPFKSSINEALEIAKKYSTTDAVPLINGVLDQIAKKKNT